ncbi:hypothetical protein ALP05_03992 [Pseudomonas caricapapayae]|uniref:Uncharacterized protein n=1 Tax=Pseudomonas caricapapayae TaxID=46678 RepID=A0A3M6EWP5_9PSED|nr:hypothetical protein [Pseudomonas caricapapayae]RMV72186.1 hypothetical protein ALP05_03992 [Pseudomonas caricapapayae]
MLNLFWRLLAKVLARPAIAAWLITRAQRTPYLHIRSADGQEVCMGRWWLFSPYDKETRVRRFIWSPWSVRIHHIKRADADRDLHDRPWNARTIILRGNYTEQRLIEHSEPAALATEYITRRPGDTAQLSFGEYHRIDEVSEDGVYTLFISGPYQGTWGFLVNGAKVAWRDYTGEKS